MTAQPSKRERLGSFSTGVRHRGSGSLVGQAHSALWAGRAAARRVGAAEGCAMTAPASNGDRLRSFSTGARHRASGLLVGQARAALWPGGLPRAGSTLFLFALPEGVR